MGYRYRPSGRGIMDIIVPTKAGIVEGEMPHGFIIPMGYMHSMREDMLSYLRVKEDVNIFTAKHSEDENVLTHISEPGLVNRFGVYVSPDTVFAVKHPWHKEVEIGKWFRRVAIYDLAELDEYLYDKPEKTGIYKTMIVQVPKHGDPNEFCDGSVLTQSFTSRSKAIRAFENNALSADCYGEVRLYEAGRNHIMSFDEQDTGMIVWKKAKK